MKRLLIIVGGVAGACAIAVPAAAGLSANPSFSERVPVRVPSSAKIVSYDDHGHVRSATPTATSIPTAPSIPTSTSSPSATTVEAGEDNHHDRHGSPAATSSAAGGGTHAEPGDDRGGASTHAEPGDDRGGRSASSAAHTTSAPEPAAGTSSSHHGGDDGSGHGGGHGSGHGSDD